jgi:hypothetical protein
MVKDDTLYERLGVSTTATTAQIKSRFRVVSLTLHPDKVINQGMTEAQIKEVTAKFRLLAGAVTVLADPKKRSVYDERGMNVIDENGNFNESLPPRHLGNAEFIYFLVHLALLIYVFRKLSVDWELYMWIVSANLLRAIEPQILRPLYDQWLLVAGMVFVMFAGAYRAYKGLAADGSRDLAETLVMMYTRTWIFGVVNTWKTGAPRLFDKTLHLYVLIVLIIGYKANKIIIGDPHDPEVTATPRRGAAAVARTTRATRITRITRNRTKTIAPKQKNRKHLKK